MFELALAEKQDLLGAFAECAWRSGCTDGKYRELEHCIFRKAAAKSKPPKKRKRWGYRDTGIMLEVMCESLAESIDTLRSTAMVLLDPWADEH